MISRATMNLKPGGNRVGRWSNMNPTEYPLWVKSEHSAVQSRCTLYPQKQTSALHKSMSAKGHKRTQADISSFDHFIRTSEQRCCERDIKRVGYGHNVASRLCAAFQLCLRMASINSVSALCEAAA